MKDIHFYADSRGCQEIVDWIQHIQKREITTHKVVRSRLVRLREIGGLIQSRPHQNFDDVKKLKGTDIWQLRVNDYRLLFFFSPKNAIVFTNHFKKKKNGTPQNEINRAENRKAIWIKNNPNL